MSKYRSKLKRHGNSKKWAKGHSSTSNPENAKHRMKAKSRFFQTNLSLDPNAEKHAQQKNVLTLEALLKHDAQMSYASEIDPGKSEATVNDIAGSMKSISLDEDMYDSETGTFKSFKTFASNYSSCTNMSFIKILNGFRANSDLHKEMLAILTALTEIIKERGGNQTSTEYYLLLLETIDASCKNDSELSAAITLLAMGIKSVPVGVLRKTFSKIAEILIKAMENFIERENTAVLRHIIGCLAILLRAQELSIWSYSSNLRYIDMILSFTVRSKPKVRKAACHAIISIIHGSPFMDNTTGEGKEYEMNENSSLIKCHPAGSRILKFCLNHLENYESNGRRKSQFSVLHMLGLLREIISCLNVEDIKLACENILSLMMAPNVMIRTKCLQTLHGLFCSRTENLNGTACGKLLSAIYEYRPNNNDNSQTLAWLTVLKEGHLHLSKLDLSLCATFLLKFVNLCCNDLWLSERIEIILGVTSSLKEILYECVKLIIVKRNLMTPNEREILRKVINLFNKVLSTPFGEISKHIILVYSVIFEVMSVEFSEELKPSLSSITKRYDAHSSLRVHIEYTIISAIKSLGPENVLETFPLTDPIKKEINIERTWILPLLREGISNASFEFFVNNILTLVSDCNKKWKEYEKQNVKSLSHTYELLCCQLWGLFPGFCREPKDPEKFSMIAKTLAITLNDNPEFRAPILDGFVEILGADDSKGENCKKQLSKFAKNFLPRLFNIYITKPNGTYEAELRNKTLEVIKLYLEVCPPTTSKELFTSAREQLQALSPGSFENYSVLDIIIHLTIHQKESDIKSIFQDYITPILKNTNTKIVSKDEQKLKKQQRKCYELLKAILSEHKDQCTNFTKKNLKSIQKLLVDSLSTSCIVCQASRLRCLKILIENQSEDINANDKLVEKTISEVILNFKEFSTRRENISQEIITLIGDLYKREDKLNEFIDIVIAGFGGDSTLISNTILALRSIVQQLTGNLTITTLEFILQQVIVFLVQKNRLQAEASVVFLITFVKVLPSPLVANHLDLIMKSLSAMVPDTKRYCRIQIGYILKKLCKKFTTEELIKLVPGNDEVTHKRLKKICKKLRQETRRKHDEHRDKFEDEDDILTGDLEKKSTTIEDILADSDTDSEILNDETNIEQSNQSKKKLKVNDVFIKESPEDALDLTDVKIVENILTNKPILKRAAVENRDKSSKDVNRGFKIAKDGRLIISDKNVSNDGSSEDKDEDSDEDFVNQANRKRGLDGDSSEGEDNILGKAKRKRTTDFMSNRKGKSSSTYKYVAGRKGIHRSLQQDVASVKSGYSGKSKTRFGAEYSSKRAKGDMKNNGKPDPYAYVPLSRKMLNKRKRVKNSSQFKNLVKRSKKSAAQKVL